MCQPTCIYLGKVLDVPLPMELKVLVLLDSLQCCMWGACDDSLAVLSHAVTCSASSQPVCDQVETVHAKCVLVYWHFKVVLLDGFTSMELKLQILVTPYRTAHRMHVVIIYPDASIKTGKLQVFIFPVYCCCSSRSLQNLGGVFGERCALVSACFRLSVVLHFSEYFSWPYRLC